VCRRCCLWGADDPFAPVGGAHRFHKQIPGSQLAVIEDGGHFVWEDAPGRSAAEVLAFLSRQAEQQLGDLCGLLDARQWPQPASRLDPA